MFVSDDPDHVAIAIFEMEDGRTQARPIVFGSREECERMAEAIPAVAYSGSGRVKRAFVTVRSSEDWSSIARGMETS